jgi:hypothetical protein
MLLGMQWGWWLVGTVGIGGSIAFLVLAPAIAMQVFTVLFRFLIGTRIGVAILVGIAVWVTSDTYRSNVDQALWKKRIAEFEQAQKDRDAKIDSAAREQVREEVEREKAAAAQTEKVTDDFVKSLPPLPSTANYCLVGPDSDRLHVIAGAPLRKGKHGVPVAPQKRAGS